MGWLFSSHHSLSRPLKHINATDSENIGESHNDLEMYCIFTTANSWGVMCYAMNLKVH